MKIIFSGGAGSVTGSCHLIESNGFRILIDCGMYQGPRELKERNYLDFSFDPATINCVLLTHAHIDHSGLLPKLIKKGYKGSIITTQMTADLLNILLYDAAHIQEMDNEWDNKRRDRKGLPPLKPLFSTDDVDNTLKLLKKIDYHEKIVISDTIYAVFHDAGHILGSAFIELYVTEFDITKKIVFSGDIGRPNRNSILRGPEVTDDADIILIESTYGTRVHKNEEDTDKEIVSVLKELVKEKGTLIIPSFAVGRTQEMIYKFFQLFDQHQIPDINIYLDSPMANKVTELYRNRQDLYDTKSLEYLQNGKNPLDLPNLKMISSVKESMDLNTLPGPKIIISASGMCDAGRIVHHLKHNLWKSTTRVLFVGYQAEGTLGRRIIEGSKKVSILGESVIVNAKIHTIGGLSAHADRDELISWLNFYFAESNNNRNKKKPYVFVVHGEPETTREFCENIKRRFDTDTFPPERGDVANIEFYSNSTKITIKKNRISGDFKNEKIHWHNSVREINDYLNRIEKTDFNYDKSLLAEMILRRLNTNIQDIIDEFRLS